MKKILALSSLVLLTLSSCAGLKQAYIEEECNVTASQRKGMVDARYGRPPRTEDYNLCADSDRNSVVSAYLEGYEAAVSRRSSTEGDGGAVTVNITQGKSGQPWNCEVTVSDDEYSGNGPTEKKTRAAVVAQCKPKHGEKACAAVTCRKN